jgi:hypothetical protein
MDDATGDSIPLAPFEEAEGDVAYVEAVRQASVWKSGPRNRKKTANRTD